MPIVVGYEVAGRVAVGEGVDTEWIGRDVHSLVRFGGYSDIVCVDHRQVLERPTGMTAEEGACVTGELPDRVSTRVRHGAPRKAKRSW